MSRKAPWGSKRRGYHPITCDVKGIPTGLWARIHPGKKFCTHVGEGPRAGQVWKKKPDNWLKVNKDLEELTYVNDIVFVQLRNCIQLRRLDSLESTQ